MSVAERESVVGTEQCGASERVSGASKRVSGAGKRVSGGVNSLVLYYASIL